MADEHWSLEMPFTLVKSEGGPYDDEAFAAGFTCGKLWQAPGNLLVIESPHIVRKELRPQIDLIAMHHWLVIVVDPDYPGGDEWESISFFRPTVMSEG